ncbi:hypothetical protein [Deinococcus peraridilitoris]|uniref:Uncharacterized protein n=1 Tax=Deinococcus peraridilitoris (strain DSM 19664 / LMG 22246 / CIP 109416 / KR-200) TaxID=937777 RepID=L0A0Z4_DEIPD|nr:hypothetical protein [Deinococcus peraridilitoris]AFZ67568.1 hypothetical protein Deipe_2072 [Deinococcus peraridilitoris DSM 19664]
MPATPQHVRDYAPTLTLPDDATLTKLLSRAQRWAEAEAAKVSVTLSDTPDTQDAVSAYTLHLLASLGASGADAGTESVEIGSVKLKLSGQAGAALSKEHAASWFDTATQHLKDAGVTGGIAALNLTFSGW